MDPSRSSTREERARRRAEEQFNRELVAWMDLDEDGAGEEVEDIQMPRVRSLREADVRINDVEELVNREVADVAEDEDSVVIIDNFEADQVVEAAGENLGVGGAEDWVDEVGVGKK